MFKKIDRVRVVPSTSKFTGLVGTVVAMGQDVFGEADEVVYLVDLDSGASIVCGAQDLELAVEDDD